MNQDADDDDDDDDYVAFAILDAADYRDRGDDGGYDKVADDRNDHADSRLVIVMDMMMVMMIKMTLTMAMMMILKMVMMIL